MILRVAKGFVRKIPEILPNFVGYGWYQYLYTFYLDEEILF